MAGTSALESVTTAFVDAMRSALDGTNPLLPELSPPNEAAARAALNDLGPRAEAVTDAADPVAWIDAVDSWRDRVFDFVDNAFGGPTGPDAALVRFLEERAPRTAAFLALTGVIIHHPSGTDDIDWTKAQALITDPGTLVNESLWDALLGDADLPGTGRLPAVIVALLLLAPQTILALSSGDMKVAGLPAPPTDAPGPWRSFREASEGWISITVPFGDPARPDPFPGNIFELAADMLPDLSATLGIHSQRLALPGGNNRTVFEMWLAVAVEGDRWQLDLGSGWFVRVEPGLSGGFGYDGDWHGAFRQFVLDAANAPGPGDPVVVTLGREQPDDPPDIVLGPPYDTRLIIQDLEVFLKVREDHPIVEIGAFVHGFAAVLTNRWWRTFGISDTVFRDGIRLDLDLDIAYVEGKGLQLNLGAGLAVTFNIDKEFGKDTSPVSFKLHDIKLLVPIQATQDSFDIRGEVRFYASLRIGPVTMVIDGLGGWVGYWTEDDEKEYVGFLPPTGAGLQISAGIFTGGGFLDFTGGPNERFGGLIYVKVGLFELTAFGLHELTGKPDDANRKTSFILVIGVRFAPGIQLGFGVEISGFGGLIGINRRADTDALRERLTSGAAGNVLFAEDPVRNAPAILGDLGALFPAAEGHHVFGPTIQLSWLNLAGAKVFKLDVGLFFEFPGPSRIILLGSARAQVPPIKDVPHLLDIRFDIVGFVDFPKSIVEFDATLISSTVMYTMNLTGDLALRVSWGDRPYLLLSFGGFHPRFDPKPAQFPDLTRLALTVKPGFLSVGIFFRAEAYLAITSNTVQFGAKLELGYAAGPLNLAGFLALDAIIQFDPFWFEVSVSAGVRLRWNSTTLAGVRFEGLISGPGPITLTGKACFEILWFDICASASITIGDSQDPAPPAVSSVTQALTPQLQDPANLNPAGGDDPQAVPQVRPAAPGAPPVVSPLGALQWTQKRAPFDVILDRFEGQPLPAQQSVVVESPQAAGKVDDWFAPGSFVNLSESEALHRPAFERLESGVQIGFGALNGSAALRHDVTVIEVRLPQPPRFHVDALLFAAITLDGVRARTAAAAVRTTAAKIGVTDERMDVRGTDGAILESGRSMTDAFQRARNIGGVALHPLDVVDIGAI